MLAIISELVGESDTVITVIMFVQFGVLSNGSPALWTVTSHI